MDPEILDALNKYLGRDKYYCWLEEAFLSIKQYTTNDEEERAEEFMNTLVRVFRIILPDNKENCLRQYMQFAGTVCNTSQLIILLNVLGKLEEEHLIGARMLCDKILLCDKLVPDNKQFWIECFKLIKKIIPRVDYKGVREIMKNCFEKAQAFPVDIHIIHLEQFRAVEDLIHCIFDRDRCLLPAYFIANEILKPIKSHWKLGRLMSDFVEEFRCIAQMITIIGHTRMLPVVESFGYTDHVMISWKLDHNTLKFNFKGSLPYDTELMEEQSYLLRYVLNQTYSKEMISVMLSLQKQPKQRCNALEEQLVSLIIAAMETYDEKANNSNNFNATEITPNEWEWIHLASQLIYFVLFQFVSFLHIVLSLHEKLEKKQLRKGRDQLMWILLQFISGSIQKNALSTFLPMFQLMDFLYPEQEPLPLPDCDKPALLRQKIVRRYFSYYILDCAFNVQRTC